MKKIYFLSILSLIAVAMIRCSPKTSKTVAGTSEAPMSADMKEGMTLWQGNCGKCHTLFQPGSRTVAEWERILPSMNRKAKLDDAQGAKVHDYLVAHAKK